MFNVNLYILKQISQTKWSQDDYFVEFVNLSEIRTTRLAECNFRLSPLCKNSGVSQAPRSFFRR